MSDEWHRHLGNLTFWEEIDRFFNPSKYSCSTFHSDVVWHFTLVLCLVLFGVAVVFGVLAYKAGKVRE